MSTTSLIYLYLVLSSLTEKLTIFLFIISFFILVYTFIKNEIEDREMYVSINETFKRFKVLFLSLMFLFILSSFIPNKKEVIYIIGGSLTVDTLSTNEAKKIPKKLMKTINVFLDVVDEKKQ